MNVSEVYVYFNKKGEMIVKAPYISTGTVRQGDDFTLNILFDIDDPRGQGPSLGSFLSVMFKIPTEKEYNLFPFLSYDKKYNLEKSKEIATEFSLVGPKVFIEKEKDLSKFGIYKNVEYNCWTFNSSTAYRGLALLTNIDGNLEVQVIEYNGLSEENFTNYLGAFNIFVEKTTHYESPFDVKQMDLDRFIEEVNELALQKAEDMAIDLLPENYVINVIPNKTEDENNIKRTESLTLVTRETVVDPETKRITQVDTVEEIEMPLPIIKEEINVNSSHEIEEQTASITGIGKEKNPLIFNLNLHKARDGYGIHAFYIDEITGELIVKAERSDDLVEENYKINENGELIIEF